MSDIHALSGAYAVDALDDLERARFEQHLTDCADCRDEVRTLTEAGSLLAETVPLAPPPALRDRVLADIATVRPLPPVVAPATGSGSADGRRRRWAPALAAAAAVAVLGVGAAVVQPWEDDETSQVPEASPAEKIRAADDSQVFDQEFEDGARATLVRSPSLNKAAIVTHDMPAAPEGKVYQLWLQHDDVMVPAGLMPEGPDNEVELEGDPRSADGFGISVEPAGGSEEPTTPPIAYVAFEQA
ncbi:anti-sigma factor [Nocardioides dongkuii]|uniref:anti-sigma factor n=1 Tax=Nocardioides dongkuii TaxID=2760089 RepID=UPI001877E8D9|nr:anti-sigma factor [Nocardioides dongkuii]